MDFFCQIVFIEFPYYGIVKKKNEKKHFHRCYFYVFHMVNFIQKLNVCICPKCWNEATYMRRKQTCIFVLSVKASAVLKLLQ